MSLYAVWLSLRHMSIHYATVKTTWSLWLDIARQEFDSLYEQEVEQDAGVDDVIVVRRHQSPRTR